MAYDPSQGRMQLLPALTVQGAPLTADFDPAGGVGIGLPPASPASGTVGKVHGPNGWLFDAFASGVFREDEVFMPLLQSTP